MKNCLFVLHWGILIEIADGFARVGRRAKGLKLLDVLESELGYFIHPIDRQVLKSGLERYRARSDKDWGLTDCISFVLMEREGITEALTADVHFRQAGFKALLLED